MIDVGLSGVITVTVSGDDTAIALGSGDVAVLGTPRVVALCEEAAVAALQGSLQPGTTSVGTSISINHIAASGVGAVVTARATVSGVDGRKVTFDVELVDGGTVAAIGTHIRYIVDHERFVSSISH